MPELHRYRLFVSHAWRYSDDYNRLINLLDAAPYFVYSNYSVPKYDPLHCSSSELSEQIRQQIRPVEVPIILMGMYAAYSDWIQFEVDYCLSLGKPILGVRPWGSERVPASVSSSASATVGWNTDSIVQAVRQLA
jgi:hypothetical protein